MILIPQIFIKAGRAVRPERTAFPLFDEDAYAMAKSMADVGSDALFISDLNVSPVGTNENIPVMAKIRKDLKVKLIVGGAFRAPPSFAPYIELGADLIVLDSHAYQQPRIVEEACARFGGKIAVHIDVRDGRVTIPGWTVAANKTAFDYAERFMEQGVTALFYSNMSVDEKTADEHLKEILDFCKRIDASIYCTNEIRGLDDIERLVTLGAPHLEGVVLGRGLYQGRIDLKGAISYVADMMLDVSNEPTLLDM